ncbi:MAG TPA: 3-dehydroquinate synthase [Gammaproteobacteria bacterium]
MSHVKVHHRNGEYDVVIGAGILANSDLRNVLSTRPGLIVTDKNVAPLWLDHLRATLPAAETLVLPAGETTKTLETVEGIWSFLAEKNLGRDAVLIALGGGVIGDMTGFAAACWMRGIDFIQIPTTLLAQVDSSIGGKTGVDLPAGKNLVGAFHQPLTVFADTDTLQTLPEREYFSGMAEIVKAALIADKVFFSWLEMNASALRAREPDALSHAIQRSCEIKAAIVTADEREHGQRALLNLGHTFAHALESTAGYERFLHGEAVAVGLVLAARLSEQQCNLDPALRPRLEALLGEFDLPVRLPADVKPDKLLHAMRLDKKHTRANWRLILLEATGAAIVREFADENAVRRALGAS